MTHRDRVGVQDNPMRIVWIRITFNGRQVIVASNQTILEAMVGAGVILRSDCGGKGRCDKR